MTETKPAKRRKPNVGSDATTGSRVGLWQIGFYAFAIGLSVILLGLSLFYVVTGRFSRLFTAAAVLVTGLSWSLLRAKIGNEAEPDGMRVGTSEPDLHEFVADIAAEVGAPMPDTIRLAVSAELAMTETTRFFGRTLDSTTLTIGLPYLQILTRQELAALVAYELAQRADLGVGNGPAALRSLRAARDVIAVERQGFVNGVYGSYARKMFRSVGGVGVAQEAAAERLAAERYGTDALVSALTKYDDIAAGFDQFLREYVVPALQNQMHPSEMFAGFGALMQSPKRAEERTRAVEKRRNKERSEFELRLTPRERLERLESGTAGTGTVTVASPGEQAHTLLDPEAKSAEIVVGTWANDLMTTRTEPQTWQQLVDNVYSVKTQSLASMVFDDEIDAAAQLEKAFDWSASGDWARVDGPMEAGLKSINDPDARRTKWARCVVVEAAAATGAFSWAQSWDGPPVLVDASGDRFDAQAIGTMIASGRSSDARSAFDEATRSPQLTREPIKGTAAGGA